MYNEENCRFLKTHEWAFVEGENAVVGISNHAQEEISDIVFVYLPIVLLINFKSLCFILLLINPKLSSIFSINESFGPLTDGSLSGVSIPLDKSFFTSDANMVLFLYMVNT